MSMHRLATPVGSSLRQAIRTSSQTQANPARVCSRCLRPLFIDQRYRHHSRRTYASATTQRPQQLASQQQPPRNAGIPETSIAGGKAGVDFSEQSSFPKSHGSSIDNSRSNTSLPEVEAQQPQPVEQEGSGPAVGTLASEPEAKSSHSKPQRKSKLRPRKAALTLSPAAVTQLRELLNQPEPKMIRVGVKNRGCSGLAYHLEYVEKPGAFDEAVDQDGVKVLVDSRALFSIIGSEMDWIEDKLSRRFIFKNPNITEQCGCGESFSIS